MTIVLDHTIVPAHDNEASAGFFARIFGLRFEGSKSHFAPVRLNDTLVLDFDTFGGEGIPRNALMIANEFVFVD